MSSESHYHSKKDRVFVRAIQRQEGMNTRVQTVEKFLRIREKTAA